MKKYKATPIDTTKYQLGESPFYDERTDTFSWVDILAGKFYRMKDRKISCQEFGEQIGAAVPSEPEGAYIVAGTKAIYKTGSENQKEILLDMAKVCDSQHRCNDAKCDPKGRFFFGVSSMTEQPGGALYCLDDTGVKMLQSDTKISNGMAWSKDRKHFYFSDSLFYQVFKYDYDIETGSISNRQVLCDISDGVPDGMTIDEDDNLWIAIWGGHRIECRDTGTGELLAVIDVPAEHVTSCAFYGDNKEHLFITSSGDALTGEFDGCLFTCRVK